MATKTITVPVNFIVTVNRLMATMQNLMPIAQQITVNTQTLNNKLALAQIHALRVQTRMSRLLLIFRKIEASIVRTISIMMNAFGTAGRLFLRGISLFAGALGPIIGATVTIGSFIIQAGITTGTYVVGFAKWLWDKMVGLSESMLQDFLTASGSLTTIGGLRAYKAAFYGLPVNPDLLENMVQSRGKQTSRQLSALINLGVTRFRDTADMTVKATIAAAHFMKRQPKGIELLMAESFGLTSIFSPEYLFALGNLPEEDLKHREELYEANKEKLNITIEARKGWIDFNLQVKKMWVEIQNVIAEKLADPNSSFVKALTQLSETFTKFVTALKNAPAVGLIVKRLEIVINKFSDWLGRKENIDKIIKIVTDFIKLMVEGIEQLKKLRDLFSTAKATPFYFGRRRLAEHVGMERTPGAPSIIPGRPIARYPGREAFTRRIGVARPAEAEPIAPRPGLRPEAGVAAPSRPVSGKVADRIATAKAAMEDQLRKEGVPEANVKEAANLLAGQALAESNLNPTLSHDQGTGYGIYGARLQRRSAMLDWLKANGYPPDSLEGQSRYMAHEAMSGKYPRTRKALTSADPANRVQSTDTITREFEAPAVINNRTGQVAGAAKVSSDRKPGTTTPAPATAPTPADQRTAPIGAGTPSNSLGEQRQKFVEELKDPELRRKLAASAEAEVGGQGREAKQAYIESVFNRALSRNKTIDETISDRHYYPITTTSKLGNSIGARTQAETDELTGAVLKGSNISNYATGNESGSVHSGGAPVTRDFGRGKERFVRENADAAWVRRQLSTSENATVEQPPVANASRGDARVSTVGNYRLGSDPRRGELLQAATEASKNLPPGWRVEAYSGERTGPGQGPHATGAAIDFRLIDPQGRSIENYQTPQNYAVYEKFAQDTHLALQKSNPGLAAQHRWGGYFSGPLGPGGQYGAMDLMHQDFAGGNARMAAGQWETGISPEWKRRWGVTESSAGLAARSRELAAQPAPAPAPAPVTQEFPEKGAEPFETYGRNVKPDVRIREDKPEQQQEGKSEHPIETLKVDNRSDHDVVAPKTSTDNDDQGPSPEPHGLSKGLYYSNDNLFHRKKVADLGKGKASPQPTLSPADAVFPNQPASRKTGVITGAPPSGVQRTPSSFYGNLSEAEGSTIPGGWVDKGDMDKSGKPLPQFTGKSRSLPGISVPFKESAGGAEKQQGDWFRVKNPRTGEWTLAQQTDIGPNVFDPVARHKGIDINAALAEKWGYAPSKKAAEATGREVYPTGKEVEWERIPSNARRRMLGTLLGIDVPKADIDKQVPTDI